MTHALQPTGADDGGFEPPERRRILSPGSLRSGAAILAFSGLTTWYTVSKVIRPHVPVRMELVAAILAGEAEPPYQYRVLKHWVARGLEGLLSPALEQTASRHVAAYSLITAVSVVAFNALLYGELRRRFGASWALLGLAWVQACYRSASPAL